MNLSDIREGMLVKVLNPDNIEVKKDPVFVSTMRSYIGCTLRVTRVKQDFVYFAGWNWAPEWLTPAATEKPLYQKFEFCRSVNCGFLQNDKCIVRSDRGCIFTAKAFHSWIKDNNFEITKIGGNCK